MQKAISIRGLSKQYGKLKALDSISFDIGEGEFFGYLGPNGAGKTTTINVITGLSNFSHGSVKVFGHDIVKDYRKARAMIGLSQQEFNFDPFLSIFDILKFQAGYYGIRKPESRVEELLKEFNLYSKKDKDFRKLSGGMKRRLQIAKALVHDPEILILDEPTAGVDVELRHNLWKYLKKLNDEGKTILLTTHYIEEAEKLCSRIGIINKGKIIALDRKENMIEKMSRQVIKIHVSGVKKLPKGIMGKSCGTSFDGSVITISCRDAQKFLPKALTMLSKNKIDIVKIDMIKDRLEDIFLRLTGNNEGGESNEFDGV